MPRIASIAVLVAVLLNAVEDGCCQLLTASPAGSPTPASVGELRRKGLDVVLIVPRAGQVKPVFDDVKAKTLGLLGAIHRLVPNARIGIVAYGSEDEGLQVKSLTGSPQSVDAFLGAIKLGAPARGDQNVLGALRAGIAMRWQPDAKKVIIVIAQSSPGRDAEALALHLALKFHSKGGTLNTVDATEGITSNAASSGGVAPRSNLEQTRRFLKRLADAGGGTCRELKQTIAPIAPTPGSGSDWMDLGDARTNANSSGMRHEHCRVLPRTWSQFSGTV